jgi:hypothetical protein
MLNTNKTFLTRHSKFKAMINCRTHEDWPKRKLCTAENEGDACSIPTQISSKYLAIAKEKAALVHSIDDNTAASTADHVRHCDIVSDWLNNASSSQSFLCVCLMLLRCFLSNIEMAITIRTRLDKTQAISNDHRANIVLTTLLSTLLRSLMKLQIK